MPVGFGVYVHIPFCAHRCDYCDFATWTDRGHLVEAYVAACRTDLARRRDVGLPPATSVFFGGGTPSLLRPELLAGILADIERVPGAEVTVECNPETVTPGTFAAYRAAGVNRVSIGMQSASPRVLAILGRRHDPASVPRAVRWAREAGIARVNLDLIYGTPGETAQDWRATLAAALACGPDHLSAYALSVEAGTPLARRVRDGTLAAVDPDTAAERYEVADEVLEAAGMRWYEISSWAHPGAECRHNLGVWLAEPYLGVGCAAHSFLGGRRSWNRRRPEDYIDAVAAGAGSEAGSETLDATAAAEERFALALRTRWGAPLGDTAGAEAARLAENGLVTLQDPGRRRTGAGNPTPPTRVVLTRRGRLLANEVTLRLLAAGAAVPDLALHPLDC